MEAFAAITGTWWFQAAGWIGSALVVFSLVQTNIMRFRWINFAGAVIAAIWNILAGMWPFVAMNGAIAIIDAYFLLKLYRERHDATVYQVVEVAPNDSYLQYLLNTNADDIAKFTNYNLAASGASDPNRSAFLVLNGDETVGAVEVENTGNGIGRVLLDWVSPKYRNFSPGEFVYQQSGVFREKGFRQLIVPPGVLTSSSDYLQRIGFNQSPEGWALSV